MRGLSLRPFADLVAHIRDQIDSTRFAANFCCQVYLRIHSHVLQVLGVN
jgi:hypothetical protein